MDQLSLVCALIVAAVASRPLVVRLWQAGRLTDRTALMMLVGRFPALCLAFAVVGQAEPLLVLLMTGPGLILAAVIYRPMRESLHSQALPLPA